MITIGINHSGYPVQRNITSLPHRDVRFRKCYDLFKLADYPIYKLMGKCFPLLGNSWCDFNIHRDIDLFHFFNAVSLCSKPWITTFEHVIPRIGPRGITIVKYYVERIAGDSCQGLIAFSDCTANLQMDYVEKHFPEYADRIREKLVTIYPPQPVVNIERSPTRSFDGVHFILVGHDFFRKGGGEILEVFDRLLPFHPNLRLTMVSGLQAGDYATATGEADRTRAKQLIAKWPDNIVHHLCLPNDKVMELMADADIALLPTYDDTFGYSVLEAQACGVPVITTDVRALPEINNEETGWLIAVPKDENGRATFRTPEGRERISMAISSGLEKIITNILEGNAEDIRKKGERARQRISKVHDPDLIASLVREQYERALS